MLSYFLQKLKFSLTFDLSTFPELFLFHLSMGLARAGGMWGTCTTPTFLTIKKKEPNMFVRVWQTHEFHCFISSSCSEGEMPPLDSLEPNNYFSQRCYFCSDLKTNKSCGPNGIPPVVLRTRSFDLPSFLLLQPFNPAEIMNSFNLC